MHRVPRILILLATLVVWLPAAAATAAAEPTPTAFMDATVKEVLAILQDGQLDSQQRRTRIEKVAHRRFDFRTMSKLVVSRYWKRFDEQQREELVKEFTDFLARTYGQRIDRYNQEKVEIVGEQPLQRGDVRVMTRIVGGEYKGAEVDYRLRKVDGGWRVIDVKIEGISLVINYRDQFKSILGREGPEGLLKILKKKNEEGAVDETAPA